MSIEYMDSIHKILVFSINYGWFHKSPYIYYLGANWYIKGALWTFNLISKLYLIVNYNLNIKHSHNSVSILTLECWNFQYYKQYFWYSACTLWSSHYECVISKFCVVYVCIKQKGIYPYVVTGSKKSVTKSNHRLIYITVYKTVINNTETLKSTLAGQA